MTDDKTGYGKPPKEHQFKPGQSGNPSGRPKKEKGQVLTDMILKKLDEMVVVNKRTRSGRHKQVKVKYAELIADRVVMGAAEGKAHSQKILFSALDKVNDASAGGSHQPDDDTGE